MTTPHITIHDCVTGETITREMNESELAQWEADQAQTARQAVLDKLGLTSDEITALLG